MSYDVTREELAQTLAQERLNYVAMKRERDANWEALDRLRSRLREIVPDVPEGGDLVAAIQRKLPAPSPPETPAPDADRCDCDGQKGQGCTICASSETPATERSEEVELTPCGRAPWTARCGKCGAEEETTIDGSFSEVAAPPGWTSETGTWRCTRCAPASYPTDPEVKP